MQLEDRIKWLHGKHKHLHAMIEAAEAEKAPEEYITKLKKEKLLLKDEIALITGKLKNK